MTPQDKVQPVQDDKNAPAQLSDLDEIALPLDDAPFELPTCHFEEAIALLQSWSEDESDAKEQRETLEYLMSVLDEDRFTARKLFP